jgi:hypothetical protein
MNHHEIIEYENGDRYEGEVKNGLPDGQGIFFYGNTKNMKVNLKMVRNREWE